MRVVKAVRGVVQVVLQGTRELAVFVSRAECHIVVLVADPDRPVPCEPAVLRDAQVLLGGPVAQILLVEHLVVVHVLVLDAAHGRVEGTQEVGAVLLDCEEDVGGPDLADGRQVLGNAPEDI